MAPKLAKAEGALSLTHLLGNSYNPKQLEYIMAPDFEVCWVGGMGAGKSYAACCAVIRHMAKFPGARVLIARSTQEELFRNPKPLFFDIVDSKGLKGYFSHPKVWNYNEKTNYVRMTNASELHFASLLTTSGEKAIDRFKNVEYSFVFIDQLEQIPFDMYQLLLLRTRYNAAPQEDRHVMSAAQDEGDNWIRRRFLTYEQPHGRPTDPLAQRRLIRGSSLENPHLDAGYKAQLLSASPEIQEAYVFATMAPGTGRLIHELKIIDPFEIPRHWPTWVGIDPARSTGITCALWVTANADKETVNGLAPNAPLFFDEYWAAGRGAEEHAAEILKKSGSRRVLSYVMDRTAWTSTILSKAHGSLSVADFYIKAGLPASQSRGDEWARVELFAAAHRRGLQVTKACDRLIAQAPEYRIRGQEVHSGPQATVIRNKQRFHAIDSGGYALSPMPTRVVPLDLHGYRDMFGIAPNVDEASRAHWTGVLATLPKVNRRGESVVTAGMDEEEFHAEDRAWDPEHQFREEEPLI